MKKGRWKQRLFSVEKEEEEDMEIEALLSALGVAEKLKDATRHSWTSGGRQESVADHSWRMAVMACLAADEFPGLDMAKVVRMCLFHDMGEAFTGDVPVFEKTAAHEEEEARRLDAWLAGLPQPQRGDLTALFREMEACESPEARLYKALDKLEVVDQHSRADLATWVPVEYTLNLTHGEKQVAWSPYLRQVKEAVNRETREKLGQKSSEKEAKTKQK